MSPEVGTKQRITFFIDGCFWGRSGKKGVVDVRKLKDHWEWFLVGGKGDPRAEALDVLPPQGGNGRG